MNIAVFSTKPYDRMFLEAANAAHGHELIYFEPRLTRKTSALAASPHWFFVCQTSPCLKLAPAAQFGLQRSFHHRALNIFSNRSAMPPISKCVSA